MNFEELRRKYQQDKDGEVLVPAKMSQLKQAIHPLTKLQRNMKNEFVMQVVSLFMMAFFPMFLGISRQCWGIYYTAYVMIVAISAYYLHGFYKFYQQVGLYNGTTVSSLWKVYYELRLNVERYRSFGFLLLPFFLVTIGLYFYSIATDAGRSIADVSKTMQYAMIAGVLFGTILALSGIILWSKYVYGPYIKTLEKLLDDLKPQE